MEVWSNYDAGTGLTVWGERRPRAEKSFIFKVFVCVDMKYECYFIIIKLRIYN